MTTYNTTKVDFNKMVPKVNRIFNKIRKIGGECELRVVREYVTVVPVYAIDELTQTKYKTREEHIECVEYVLNFPPYVVGDYRFGATVERTLDDSVNAVYVGDDAVNFADYLHTPLVCEHCRKNYSRNKVVVLIDNKTGAHKMVGTGCLKDYAGYNIEQFARYFTALTEITLENKEPWILDSEFGNYKVVLDPKEYLAYCIQIVRKNGYTKEAKCDAYEAMKKNKPLDEDNMAIAQEVIDFFENYATDDPFESNTRLYVTGRLPITYENGMVAYAYVLYKKIIERLEKEAQRAAQRAISNYVGNVGDKITIIGRMEAISGFRTDWGYTTIFKITDDNGNVYIWKTTTYPDVRDENGEIIKIDERKLRITATIKEHNEFRDEKQTVVTRCKVCGVA